MNSEEKQRIENQKLISETNKLIIDMKHSLNLEHQWDIQEKERENRAIAQDKIWEAQSKMWEAQKIHYENTFKISMVAVILTGLGVIAAILFGQ